MAKPQLDALNSFSTGAGTTPLDPASLPNFTPTKNGNGMKDYRVRYLIANINNPGDVSELEKIETKVLRGENVFVLDKKNYIFMDNMYFVLQYVEKAD